MSYWSHHVEEFDEEVRIMALAGEFGPEIQNKVVNGDLCDWEIFEELTPGQQMEAMDRANTARYERHADMADYYRKAAKESLK